MKSRYWPQVVIILLLVVCGIQTIAVWSLHETAERNAPGHQDIVEADAADGILFFGDSYSFGIGASNRHERWTSLLSGQLDMTEINAAIPGEGYERRPARCETRTCPYFLERIQQFSSVDAKYVFLAGGQNDLSKVEGGSSALSESIFKTLSYLKTSYPTAKVYVIGTTTPEVLQNQATKLDSILAEQSNKAGVQYISLRPIWSVLWNNTISDRQHVNDTGHEKIAEYIYSKL